MDDEEDGGAEHSWGHIWVLDALYAVLVHHVDDVAKTTTKDGFSMDFRKNGTSICALDHFEDRPRILFVNVAVSRVLWFALRGIGHEHDLEFREFEGRGVADAAVTGKKED